MSDPLAIAAAERHLRACMSELATCLLQIGLHQYHDALTEHPQLQEVIVKGEEASMALEEMAGLVSQATSLIDHEIETGLRKAA